ncbi:hypothetical protein PBAL39_05043 [Pedobacter sp. BAL39]|nr:hypothetical protein PBAL39_05043 [Pedobacter sp. BAL39]
MSVAKLTETLQTADYELEVFSTTANGSTELNVSPDSMHLVDGVRVWYFKRLTKDHSHFSPSLLIKLWNNVKRFDVIHIHAWWNLVSVLSCSIALLRGVPVVLSPRGTLSNYSFNKRHTGLKALFHLLLGKPLLSRCYIHTTTSHETKTVQTRCTSRKTFTIANFVKLPVNPLSKEHQATKVQDATLKLIFLSRIDEKKGLDLLLQALRFQQRPFHLTIAGNGTDSYIKQLKTIAADLQLEQHITWKGFAFEDKFRMLAAHDLLVLPSHDENFGNVVIESLSVGTAVLLGTGVGLADYVSSNQLGWVSSNDVETLSRFLHYADQHREQLAMIRERSPQRISVDFDDRHLLHQYQNMYQSVYLQNR